MRRVIMESPYNGPTEADIERNKAYARACVRDCLLRGESAIALHLLYTQPGILRDEVAEERALGIKAGLVWGEVAEATVCYIDRGISQGMAHGIEHARAAGRPVEYRYLGKEWED